MRQTVAITRNRSSSIDLISALFEILGSICDSSHVIGLLCDYNVIFRGNEST